MKHITVLLLTICLSSFGFSQSTNDNYEYFESFTIQGKEYSNVVVMKNTAEGSEYTEVKVAKGYGIIELTDKNGDSWQLVTDK